VHTDFWAGGVESIHIPSPFQNFRRCPVKIRIPFDPPYFSSFLFTIVSLPYRRLLRNISSKASKRSSRYDFYSPSFRVSSNTYTKRIRIAGSI
jgi:hypothetical protein